MAYFVKCRDPILKKIAIYVAQIQTLYYLSLAAVDSVKVTGLFLVF